MNFLKQNVLFSVLCILIQIVPFTILHAHAQTNHEVNDEIVEAIRSQKSDLLTMSTTVQSTEAPMYDRSAETIQEFSFVNKTFATDVGQPVLLRFTSKLAASEVLIRIPSEGEVLASHLYDGVSLQHSHGDYWTFRTQTKQTQFDLPVVFGTSGKYFVTIDHDADYFYLEVEDVKESNQSEGEEISEEVEANNQGNIQMINVVEHHLYISEYLLEFEEARILEETRDPQNRSTSNVSSWSQFRSAWNSSSTTRINISNSISDGLRSLNTRSSSIIIDFNGRSNQLIISDGGLQLSGSANLDIINGSNDSTSYNYLGAVIHNGSGKVSVSSNAKIGAGMNHYNSHALSAQHISLQNGGYVRMRTVVRNNGTLEITTTSGVGSNNITGIYSLFDRILEGTANVYIQGNRLLIDHSGHNNGGKQTWNSANLHLRGQNGSEVALAETDPDDFKDRYPIQGLGNCGYIILNASESDWVAPPLPTYILLIQASPIQGGNPATHESNIQQGGTTTISANPNEGYLFSHWEIVEGVGSTIDSVTSQTTTFTMGSQNTVVRAFYEENQSGEVHVYHTDREGHDLIEQEVLTGTIGEGYQTQPATITNYQLFETPDNASGQFTDETIAVVYVYDIENVTPVDPLDPEVEIDPENKPELPEDQGLLSIDFVSNFNFSSQAISVHDQTYYAQPQRLLNEDQSVNEDESRPNYIQVSDRRSENERNGWQLAVTQKEQFQTENANELDGAQLKLMNQQLVTAQNGKEPSLQATNPLNLVPENKRTLVRAEGNEGAGTWIYRFGNADTAEESVALYVPKGAIPEAQHYSTTLLWELSAVPGN